jgi:hypothetical protein
MLYQLPNGRTIEMSVEQYLDMTDDDFAYLIAHNFGDELEDPWFGSVLTKPGSIDPIIEPTITDLTQISDKEKLEYPDLDIEIDSE